MPQPRLEEVVRNNDRDLNEPPEVVVVEGIGPQTAQSLEQQGYGSLEGLSDASVNDLLQIPGIGNGTLRTIQSSLKIILGLSEYPFQDNYLLANEVDTIEKLLEWETDAVWVEDPSDLAFVRQSLVGVARRKDAQLWSGPGELVGYVDIRKDMPNNGFNGRFLRRVLWVKDYDRKKSEDSTWPREAIPLEDVVAGELDDQYYYHRRNC